MGTVTFFGAKEIQSKLQMQSAESEIIRDIAGLPALSFDFNDDFVQQDCYMEDSEDHKSSNNDQDNVQLQWAIIDFQTPVYCPLNSLIIGSRLDTDIQANTCRLAFSGKLIEKFDPVHDMKRIRFYSRKERTGTICKLGDPFKRADDGKVVRYEVFGSDLFKKETNMTQFIGLHLETDVGDIGVIQSSFGTSGKFKMYFPSGTTAKNGDALYLRFKRYLNDPDKKIRQDSVLPSERVGARLEQDTKTNGKKTTKRVGTIVNTKGDSENSLYHSVIVEGLFTPQENIREVVGSKISVVGTDQVGAIDGPFGKAGKCKVTFTEGVSVDAIGRKVELIFIK